MCQKALERRKIARERWLNDANNHEKESIFRVKRKEAHNIIRCKKRKYVQNVIKKTEQDYRSHNTRQLYHKVNSFKGGYRRQEKYLKKKRWKPSDEPGRNNGEVGRVL